MITEDEWTALGLALECYNQWHIIELHPDWPDINPNPDDLEVGQYEEIEGEDDLWYLGLYITVFDQETDEPSEEFVCLGNFPTQQQAEHVAVILKLSI